MIKGALFDMDGLMFDTEAIAQQGWAEAARVLNYPITVEVSRQLLGRTAADSKALFFTLFGDAVDYDKARAVRTDYLTRYLSEHGVPKKKGLAELLSYLKEAGIPACVATSTSRERAEEYLKNAGVYDFFSGYVYGDMVKNGKPDPEAFLKAAAELSLDPRDCVVLEDSKNGIKAGAAAGCKVIAVPDLLPLDDMSEYYTVCCGDLLEAMDFIKRENA